MRVFNDKYKYVYLFLNKRTVLSPISCVALNFLMAAALTFSLAYFPMRARSSGVKEFVYLRLLALFSFSCKALTAWLTSWSTLGDSCVWLAVGIPMQTHGSKILY